MTARRPVRLHWMAVQPTPYNAHLFRAIAADDRLELTVHYARPALPSHPWRTSLREGYESRVFAPRLGLDGRALADSLGRADFVVVAGWEEATKRTVLTLLGLLGRPHAVWTDTPRVERRSRPRWREVLRRRWLRFVFERATRVLGTGRPARDALLRLGCPREKFVEFPFFVDLERYRPADGGGRPGRDPVFLSVGRLDVADKGFDLALDALAAVREEGAPPFRYRIAGDGPDRPTLERRIRRLGLEDVAEVLGWAEPDELAELYRRADALVHPARYDPFPVAVLEAMASGLPVIGSSAAGSVRDRVADGVNGWVHESGSARDLARRIRAFLDAPPERRAEMGARARSTAQEWPVSRGVEIVHRVATSR